VEGGARGDERDSVKSPRAVLLFATTQPRSKPPAPAPRTWTSVMNHPLGVSSTLQSPSRPRCLTKSVSVSHLVAFMWTWWRSWMYSLYTTCAAMREWGCLGGWVGWGVGGGLLVEVDDRGVLFGETTATIEQPSRIAVEPAPKGSC